MFALCFFLMGADQEVTIDKNKSWGSSTSQTDPFLYGPSVPSASHGFPSFFSVSPSDPGRWQLSVTPTLFRQVTKSIEKAEAGD